MESVGQGVASMLETELDSPGLCWVTASATQIQCSPKPQEVDGAWVVISALECPQHPPYYVIIVIICLLPWTGTDLKFCVSIHISSKFCSLDWTLNTKVRPQTFMGDARNLIVVVFGERGWKTIIFYFTPFYTVGSFYMTGEWGAKEMTRTWRILQPIGGDRTVIHGRYKSRIILLQGSLHASLKEIKGKRVI